MLDEWRGAHYSCQACRTKSRELIGASCESKRVPSLNAGFSRNEIKANTAACKWVKHNIHYGSNYKSAIQSAGSLGWDCSDERCVRGAHCISGVLLQNLCPIWMTSFDYSFAKYWLLKVPWHREWTPCFVCRLLNKIWEAATADVSQFPAASPSQPHSASVEQQA